MNMLSITLVILVKNRQSILSKVRLDINHFHTHFSSGEGHGGSNPTT